MTRLTLDPTGSALLLIDAQPAFWDGMHGNRAPVLARVAHLLRLVEAFHLPCIATFEHPVESKGWLPEPLERAFPASGQRLVKHTYNCCDEPAIRDVLAKLPGRQIVVGGAETDVCVLQSVLGLLALDFQVFLLEDCLFTSEPHPGPALARMYQAGAIPLTYKALYYELKRTVDVPPLHLAWNEDAGDVERFRAPEELPVWEPRR